MPFAAALGPSLSVSILALDNRTGAVLAQVGSPGHGDASRSGAIDMTVAIRSPGSALKPFIYALAFEQGVGIDGVVLTKLDGDARGGAALSIANVIGKPIMFASNGEKISDFDVFHPDRMAPRILGMGDVLTLIEQAEKTFDADQTRAATEKLLAGRTP